VPIPTKQPEASIPASVTPPDNGKPIEVAPLPPPKPAPQVKQEPGKPADARKEITSVIDGWLAAWSRKDTKGYLTYYAQDFQPQQGQSRKTWETDRKQRIAKPGKIEVRREKLDIALDTADKATARFRQNYVSAGFNASSNKTLILVKRDGKWLIREERVGG
jgi:ketosteroid isomerase-like protein